MDRRRQSMARLHQNMSRMQERINRKMDIIDYKINDYATGIGENTNRIEQNMNEMLQSGHQSIVLMDRDMAEIDQSVAKMNEAMGRIDQGMVRMEEGLARIDESMATMATMAQIINRNVTAMHRSMNRGLPRMNQSTIHIMHQNTPRMNLSMPRTNQSTATTGKITSFNATGMYQTTNRMNQIINSTMPQNMSGGPRFQLRRNRNFRGLSTTDINRLPTRTYVPPDSSASGSNSESLQERTELNNCAVCQINFVTGDTLRVLQCFHEFHTSCIDPWFAANRICPVCRLEVNLDI